MSSTSYPRNAEDWQGRFIANLAAALARRDDVTLNLWAPPGALPAGVADASTPADARWLGRLSQRGGIAHLLRTRKVLAVGTILSLLGRLGRAYRRQRSDVVHVNWLQNALPLWGTTTPTLITVLGTDFALLKLPGMKAVMRSMLRQRRAILAPNAQWMQPALEQAFGDLAEIRPIAFGVDDPWFEVVRQPPIGLRRCARDDEAVVIANEVKQSMFPEGMDRHAALAMTKGRLAVTKGRLAVTKGRLAVTGTRHWLAITRLTKNKIGDLFTWGDGLFGEHRQLHLFGPMQEQVELPSWVIYHGPTYPADLLQEWFPKACGLITLSRHDEGRPQVMLEAMAAGLPVLASDLPAHRDMLQHRQTGWLAATPDELHQGLDWLEDPVHNQQTGQAARQWVRNTVGTWDDCAGRYAAAYKDLLERRA